MPSTIVRADGKISIPLIKEVDVMGLTPSELEKMMTERISKLIHGADVTVIVKEVNSRKVYLLGGLKKEGPVPLPASMTVLQAINAAGGLTEYAKRKKIYILRNENGQQCGSRSIIRRSSRVSARSRIFFCGRTTTSSYPNKE